MTQVCENTVIEVEMEEFEEEAARESKEKKVNNLIGDLNPRYFERIMTLKKAKQKIFASKGYASNFRLM